MLQQSVVWKQRRRHHQLRHRRINGSVFVSVVGAPVNASRYVSFSRGTPAERQGTGGRPPSLCNRIGICSLFPGASTGSPTRSLQSLRQDVEFQIELSIQSLRQDVEFQIELSILGPRINRLDRFKPNRSGGALLTDIQETN